MRYRPEDARSGMNDKKKTKQLTINNIKETNMEKHEIFSEFPYKILNPDDAHYFYGYYDLMPYSADGKRHLCHKVAFIDRLPTKDDVAELGYLENGKFTKLAETTAWNFQQGSLLQYCRENPDIIFYNTEEDGAYRTVCLDTVTGKKTVTERATATISRDGTHGLAVNFSRIYDFRPGYGYCSIPDKYKDIGSPKEDGVFYVDFKTGKSRMLCNYEDIIKSFPIEGKNGSKFVVNHINLNPSGDKYLMLVRDFPDPEKRDPNKAPWGTSAYIGDMQGNLKRIFTDSIFSHYWWDDDKTVIAAAKDPDGNPFGIYFIDTETGKFDRICPEYTHDIHCIIDPTHRFMIGDNYARQIMFKDLTKDEEIRPILQAYSITPDIIDIRCDLHDRFSRNGRAISFDTTFRGRRDIVELDISSLYN